VIDDLKQNSTGLPDTQNERDTRGIAINWVGVKGIRVPICLHEHDMRPQHSVAWVDLSVNLPEHLKGTHMSRFVEVVQSHLSDPFQLAGFPSMLTSLQSRLDANHASVSMSFPIFVEKTAPASGKKSLMDYSLTLRAKHLDGRCEQSLELHIPVTTLCPCSKAISRYGAHNQRGEVRLLVAFDEPPSLPQIIEAVESSASSQLYALLKRPDEKMVTEQAYENPVFVEDLVRNTVLALRAIPGLKECRVEAENFESIHNHNAYACVEVKLQST
jgi:GTP cyclohydrolase I